MTQDTRKDRRAKIVSLNVRYKSATVDEFIDNHSHDVSKGGLFIKTASPFPPGTLLKFEIRIAGDKAVIAGVGRVVWKRETAQAGPEAPAGMGVKFIKIDDASRTVIDKLVLSRGEAKNAYDDGGGDVGSAPATPERPSATPSAAVTKSVGPGGVSQPSGAAGGKDVPKPGTAPPAAGSGGARPHSSPFQPTPSASKFPGAGKATIAGLGGIQGPAKPPRTPVPAAGRPAADSLRPRTAPSGRTPLSTSSQGTFQGASSIPSTKPMFPKTNSEGEMPPKNEQTVMKQAAELLEEALRGAGGSMEEIGQNPLFDLAKQDAGPAGSTAALIKDKTSSTPAPAPRPSPGSGAASASRSRPPSNESEWEGPGSAPKGSPAPELAAQSALPLASAARVAQGDIETTVRSATRDEAPAKPKTLSARPSDVSPARPLAAGSLLAEEEPPKNKWLIPVLAVAAVGVLGFLLYTRIYAPGANNPNTPPAPAPSAKMDELPSASAGAPAAGSVAPSASAAPEVPSASASASVSLDAAASALAATATAASPKPAAPAPAWHPPPKPKPKATATEESPSPAVTEGTAQPTAPSPPSESPTAPATVSPAATASSTAIPSPTPSASPPAPNAPAKPPAGKPKQDDDNPY